MRGFRENPLTEEAMEGLADKARGFYGAPHPAELLSAMQALHPDKIPEFDKLTALKAAYEQSKSGDGSELDGIHAQVRALLGLPQTAAQDEALWNFVHPSA